MEKPLTPKQTLFLFRLFFGEEGVTCSRTNPRMNPEDRKVLLEKDLITTQKEGRSTRIYLTDRAWDWVSEHLTLPILSTKGPTPRACGLLAQELLFRLQKRLEEGILTLSEFSAPEAASGADIPENPPASPQAPSLEEMILETSSGLMAELSTDTLHLKDLRARLEHIPASSMDQALIRLQQQGVLALLSYQDPLTRTDEDNEAALHLGKVARHLLQFC